jgi:chromosome segregation ATPase
MSNAEDNVFSDDLTQEEISSCINNIKTGESDLKELTSKIESMDNYRPSEYSLDRYLSSQNTKRPTITKIYDTLSDDEGNSDEDVLNSMNNNLLNINMAIQKLMREIDRNKKIMVHNNNALESLNRRMDSMEVKINYILEVIEKSYGRSKLA